MLRIREIKQKVYRKLQTNPFEHDRFISRINDDNDEWTVNHHRYLGYNNYQ